MLSNCSRLFVRLSFIQSRNLCIRDLLSASGIHLLGFINIERDFCRIFNTKLKSSTLVIRY